MGDYQDFPSKIFCLTVPKSFVGEPFSVSIFSGIEKFYAQSLYHDFLSKFFVSEYQKTSSVNSSVLCFKKFPVAKKFIDKTGGGRVSEFTVEFFRHTLPKFPQGNPSLLHYFRVSKRFG